MAIARIVAKVKVIKFVKGILEGCLTIIKLKQKGAYIFHTFFIWAAYVGMFWITALALPQMETINLNAVFACFVAGAIARHSSDILQPNSHEQPLRHEKHLNN